LNSWIQKISWVNLR